MATVKARTNPDNPQYLTDIKSLSRGRHSSVPLTTDYKEMTGIAELMLDTEVLAIGSVFLNS